MGSQPVGRRRVLKQGAGLGLAVSAIGLAASGVSTLAQSGTPSTGGETDLEKLKSDVRAMYDKAKSDIDALGSDITDASKATYDELKKGLDAIGDELARAESIPSDSVREAKRAYRDVQHHIADLDLEAHHAIHATAETSHDAWHEVRKGLHSVHKSIDHVIDAI
jgi:hypothetical protein